MAANGVRNFLFSSAAAKTLFTRSTSPFCSKASSFSGPSSKHSSAIRFSINNLHFSRFPVSITASALFTSLLSLHNNTWGCLSEGFATPL